MRLYHFTCNAGRKGIEATGYVEPHTIEGIGTLAWFTSEPHPDAYATGLLRHGHCYHGAWRFVAANDSPCHPWFSSPERERVDAKVLSDIEIPGDPEHWYISTGPVKVVLG
jgi:hypothetical protein